MQAGGARRQQRQSAVDGDGRRLQEGPRNHSPPLPYKNLVVSGMAGGEYGVRGFIEAFDQNTGQSVWKTYTIRPGRARQR